MNRVGVFLAVQTVQADAAGHDMPFGGAIEGAFHPSDEALREGSGRARVAAGWHLLAAQLADDLFHDLRITRDIGLGQGVKGNATGPVFGVMALAAVLTEKSPGGRLCRRCSLRRRSSHDQR